MTLGKADEKQKPANRVGISAFQISAFCFSNQPPRNAVKPERRLTAGFGRSRDLHTPMNQACLSGWLTNPHSGGAALLRGLNITAARQRRPTLIGRQPGEHGSFPLLGERVWVMALVP